MTSQKFDTFLEAVIYVGEHGRIGYQAPLSYHCGMLDARVIPGGIEVTIHIPAEGEWPAETYTRLATLAESVTDSGHFARLRRMR